MVDGLNSSGVSLGIPTGIDAFRQYEVDDYCREKSVYPAKVYAHHRCPVFSFLFYGLYANENTDRYFGIVHCNSLA